MAIASSVDPVLTKLIPIAKADVFNAALPAADNALLSSAITPSNSPSYVTIYVCVSVAGIFKLARTRGGTTITEVLNSGNSLNADAAYMFNIPWRTGDSLNVQYSATGGTLKRLTMEEVSLALLG